MIVHSWNAVTKELVEQLNQWFSLSRRDPSAWKPPGKRFLGSSDDFASVGLDGSPEVVFIGCSLGCPNLHAGLESTDLT